MTSRPTPGQLKHIILLSLFTTGDTNVCEPHTCNRTSELRTIESTDVILFEGILVLYDREMRDMMHMKLFVDTDSDTRLARRGRPCNNHSFDS